MVRIKCEVCGADNASKKAVIDGAEMKVCENCVSLGTEKQDLSKKKRNRRKNRSKSKTYSTSRSKEKKIKVLKDNYGNIVKKSREAEGLKIEELASELAVKESVLRKIETGKLKPRKDLRKKLEKKFEIELQEEVSTDTDDVKDNSSDKDSLTIGDVAEIK